MHFLILKTSSLGDILHAFPALSYLRQKFPLCEISWVVEAPFAELVSSHPDVNHVITLNSKQWRKELKKGKTWSDVKIFIKKLREKKYDVVFDLQGNVKSSLILALLRAKEKVGFGRKSVHEWPNLFFTSFKANPPVGVNIREDNLFLLQSYFSDPLSYKEKGVSLRLSESEKTLLDEILEKNKSPYPVLVCPGAFWPNKKASPETLISILKEVQSKKAAARFLFAWGSNEEKKFVEELKGSFSESFLLPKLSLPLLQNLMGNMKLVVAMDSLPLHLAGTTKTKTFSLFGPSSGKKFAPAGENHIFFQGYCPYKMTFHKRCTELRRCKTGECIKKMDEESLFKQMETLF